MSIFLMGSDVLSIDRLSWNSLRSAYMNSWLWYAVSSALLHKYPCPNATTVGSRCLCRYGLWCCGLWSAVNSRRVWAKSTSPAQSRRAQHPRRPKNHGVIAASRKGAYYDQCDVVYIRLLYIVTPTITSGTQVIS